jgi:hypothetical protein
MLDMPRMHDVKAPMAMDDHAPARASRVADSQEPVEIADLLAGGQRASKGLCFGRISD